MSLPLEARTAKKLGVPTYIIERALSSREKGILFERNLFSFSFPFTELSICFFLSSARAQETF